MAKAGVLFLHVVLISANFILFEVPHYYLPQQSSTTVHGIFIVQFIFDWPQEIKIFLFFSSLQDPSTSEDLMPATAGSSTPVPMGADTTQGQGS